MIVGGIGFPEDDDMPGSNDVYERKGYAVSKRVIFGNTGRI
jgi:hypothetical protein